MVIRNLRQKKIVNTKVVSLFIILCVGTYFLIRLFSGIIDRVNQTPQENMIYTLGATLTFSGKLVHDNQFPNYTHSIITQDGVKIGLMSTSTNLNTYVGQKIELVGMVKKYFKITPVIEVNVLKFPDQGFILKDNRYFFVNDLLYLDFSSHPQLSATKSGVDILVFFNDVPVVKIEFFACSKVIKSRDCSYLITNYIQTNTDTFDSHLGYTFYKHGTGFWTVFDSNTYGFLFKDVSDDMVLDISNMFKMVNKLFVIENKMEIIQDYCYDDLSKIRTIDIMEGSFSYIDPYLIVLDLVGTDTKNNPAICKIIFDVWDDRKVIEWSYNEE